MVARRERAPDFDMPTDPHPPGFEEIESAELARTFGKVIGVRVLIAPVVGLLAVVWAFFEPARWRQAVLVLAAAGLSSVSLLEVRRYRRRGFTPAALSFNIAVGVFGQLVVSAATGGLESPLMPLLISISILSGVFIESLWLRASLMGGQILAIWSLLAVALAGQVPSWNPGAFGGGPRAGHNDLLLVAQACFFTLAALLATAVGRGMHGVFRSILRRAFQAREESLKAHADRSRELMALSGEIAHELKNPLASVKGLAALLEKSAPDAKAAERLGVLRREVDRMQGILDEFLNFSRPPVPLAPEPVDLLELCGEVAALHEGLARERGIALLVRGEAAPVRCDPRKVKQVLINLVQNALDASPAGSEVEIELGEGADLARLSVLDRGAGIDPAVESCVFEPGVTTKARGSGLGLTIARALARQHAGELTLEDRGGGGCQATLTLPREAAQFGGAA